MTAIVKVLPSHVAMHHSTLGVGRQVVVVRVKADTITNHYEEGRREGREKRGEGEEDRGERKREAYGEEERGEGERGGRRKIGRRRGEGEERG